MNIGNSLQIDLEKFGFIEREFINGRKVSNRCGRDFLYYVLNFYFPNEFNPKICGPVEIEKMKLFGLPTSSSLVWTCLPFYKVPKMLFERELFLEINNSPIRSFADFVKAIILPKHLSTEKILKIVEASIDENRACGIDILIPGKLFMNHVLFVLGYDEEYLYVADTHKVDKLDYEKLTAKNDNRFIMKLSKEAIQKAESRFSRVWVVKY